MDGVPRPEDQAYHTPHGLLGHQAGRLGLPQVEGCRAHLRRVRPHQRRRTVEGACGRKAHRVQGDRGGVHDVHNTGGLPVPQGVDGLPSGPGGEGDTRVLAHA